MRTSLAPIFSRLSTVFVPVIAQGVGFDAKQKFASAKKSKLREDLVLSSEADYAF